MTGTSLVLPVTKPAVSEAPNGTPARQHHSLPLTAVILSWCTNSDVILPLSLLSDASTCFKTLCSIDYWSLHADFLWQSILRAYVTSVSHVFSSSCTVNFLSGKCQRFGKQVNSWQYTRINSAYVE